MSWINSPILGIILFLLVIFLIAELARRNGKRQAEQEPGFQGVWPERVTDMHCLEFLEMVDGPCPNPSPKRLELVRQALEYDRAYCLRMRMLP